jgi:hypothetical protein
LHNADLDEINDEGQTPLDVANENEKEEVAAYILFLKESIGKSRHQNVVDTGNDGQPSRMNE